MNALLAVDALPGALLTRIVGAQNLTAHEADQLEAEAAALPSSDVVVVDLSQVRQVDAAGVGALVRWERRLAQAGSQLRLAAPRREVATVLELLRLHRLFEVYGEVEQALQDDASEPW